MFAARRLRGLVAAGGLAVVEMRHDRRRSTLAVPRLIAGRMTSLARVAVLARRAMLVRATAVAPDATFTFASVAVIRRRWLTSPVDALADQFLDRGQRFGIGGANDGDCGAGLAGAAGAADPVNIVVGVVRHVEIEDVTDVRNIEAAGGDVGGDQQRHGAVAE